MSVKKNVKSKIIGENARHNTDTGSPEVQVALYTERIKVLTEHFKAHKHDHNSRIGLIKLVGKRKRVLDYLRREDEQRYKTLIGNLGLRK